MADIKATSFRLNEEDIVKFKEFAEEQGYNQAEAFKSMIQTLEMAKAKNMIKDRAKEIEVFQDTINNLMSMFLNSLNVNQTSEERIREELSQELQTKDNTISNLYEQLQDIKADNKQLQENNKLLTDDMNAVVEDVKKLNFDIAEKQKNIDKLNSNNDLLQEQLQEYKEYKNNYKKLNSQLNQLREEHEELKKNNNKLINENELLNNKISANTDMIEFYKNEITSKDKDIDNYKAEHEKALNEKLKNNIDNLNAKHEIELSKKDLEIQKLNNEIQELHRSKIKFTKKVED